MEQLISWCQDCCSNRWSYDEANIDPVILNEYRITVYTFYFVSKLDMDLFQKAHLTEMRLALETDPR